MVRKGELNHTRPLIPRKLLIPYPNPANVNNITSLLRYKSGTRSYRRAGR